MPCSLIDGTKVVEEPLAFVLHAKAGIHNVSYVFTSIIIMPIMIFTVIYITIATFIIIIIIIIIIGARISQSV